VITLIFPVFAMKVLRQRNQLRPRPELPFATTITKLPHPRRETLFARDLGFIWAPRNDGIECSRSIRCLDQGVAQSAPLKVPRWSTNVSERSLAKKPDVHVARSDLNNLRRRHGPEIASRQHTLAQRAIQPTVVLVKFSGALLVLILLVSVETGVAIAMSLRFDGNQQRRDAQELRF
jgi:hypothetical protein